MNDYIFLRPEEIIKIRSELSRQEKYLYHGTLNGNLASIKTGGIDPAFEHERSNYGLRREPKAMRYCTQRSLCVAISTAQTRSCEASECGSCVASAAKPVLLRTPSLAVLERRFGLDHSFGGMAGEAENIFATHGHVRAEDFIRLVSSYGSISCYDIIPPDELEVLEGDFDNYVTAPEASDQNWVRLFE